MKSDQKRSYRLQYKVSEHIMDKIEKLKKLNQQSGTEVIESLVLNFDLMQELNGRFDKLESMIKELENKIK